MEQSFEIAGPTKIGLVASMPIQGGGSTRFAGTIQQMKRMEYRIWTEGAEYLYEGDVTDVMVDGR